MGSPLGTYGGELLIDKRNPNLVRGDGETWSSFAGRLGEHISQLEWQSGGHIMWYTHKNPAGCWICELLQICRQYQDILLDNGIVRELDTEDVNSTKSS